MRTVYDFLAREIQTLLNVGLLDAMQAGPVRIETFAEQNGLDARLLKGICEALHSRRILRRSDAGWSLDEKGRFLVDTNIARGWFDLAYGYENVLYNMEGLLRKQIVYGKDLVRDGRFVAVGSGLASLDFYFPLVCNLIQRAGYRKVLDIGCGDGTFLRYMCKRLPNVQGVGLDLSPAAVAAGNESLARENLSGRIRLHAGDAMEIEKVKDKLEGVDAATTFFVLHELCDNNGNARVLKFLNAFRQALPKVPFHIIEAVRPSADEMRERPGPAVEYFLFHDLSGQMPIGREDWKHLYRKSGFERIDEDYIGFARTSIYTLHASNGASPRKP